MREKVEVWLQCRSNELQKRIFEQHAAVNGTLAIDNLADCLAVLGIQASGV